MGALPIRPQPQTRPQGHLGALLALGDDLSEGLVGIDAELPRPALRAAPYIKVRPRLCV